MGYMNGNWLDVHGAGAQRSDPKTGDPADWPTGHDPQGDAIRIYNYVRCTRGGEVTVTPDGDPDATPPAMMVESTSVQQDPAGGLPGSTPGQGGIPPGGGPPLEASASSPAKVSVLKHAFCACRMQAHLHPPKHPFFG
jgi:hypothetical protein